MKLPQSQDPTQGSASDRQGNGNNYLNPCYDIFAGSLWEQFEKQKLQGPPLLALAPVISLSLGTHLESHRESEWPVCVCVCVCACTRKRDQSWGPGSGAKGENCPGKDPNKSPLPTLCPTSRLQATGAQPSPAQPRTSLLCFPQANPGGSLFGW